MKVLAGCTEKDYLEWLRKESWKGGVQMTPRDVLDECVEKLPLAGPTPGHNSPRNNSPDITCPVFN